MKLIIEENSEKALDFAALYIVKRINDFKPGPDKFFVLGLQAANDLLGMYKKLIELHNEGKVSFQFVKTFNSQEYVGFPRDSKESTHSFMLNNFFRRVDIHPANVYILDGNASDLDKECKDYEQKIKDAGGIELFVGSIGTDGRIALNEQGSSLESRTRIKTLALETKQDHAKYFGNDVNNVPSQGLTVGVATVMECREVMMLILGVQKSPALANAIEGSVSHMCTLSQFQMHPLTTFVADEDATLELKMKTYKYFKGLMGHHLKMIQPNA